MKTVKETWWMLLLRGVVAIAFGLLTLLTPKLTLAALILVFAACLIAEGVVFLVGAARLATHRDRWLDLALYGVLSLALGVMTAIWPGLSAFALLYVIAASAVVAGAKDVYLAIRLRRELVGEWLLAVVGLISIAFGVFIATFPGAGALAIVIWIGAYALVRGVALLISGFGQRALQRRLSEPLSMPPMWRERTL